MEGIEQMVLFRDCLAEDTLPPADVFFRGVTKVFVVVLAWLALVSAKLFSSG